MGWEKGRYYTRTKRVDGKVVREYFDLVQSRVTDRVSWC
jgi:hypothetical protein